MKLYVCIYMKINVQKTSFTAYHVIIVQFQIESKICGWLYSFANKKT